MERKLLFFDIDGTLAMAGKPPSAAVVNAIRTARKNGHFVFLSTGRAEWLVDTTIKEIGFDGGIYHAGGRAIVNNTVVLDQCMPSDVLSSALELLRKENGIYFILECADCCHRNDPTPFVEAIKRMNSASSELLRLSKTLLDPAHKDERRYQGEPVYKISYFMPDRAQLERITTLLGKVGKAIYFENIVPNAAFFCGEVTAFGTDKGLALEKVCHYCGTDKSHAIAFGDSANDAEMIVTAGLGIAMGNAEERLKHLADKVCNSIDADGVALELEALGLLSESHPVTTNDWSFLTSNQ